MKTVSQTESRSQISKYDKDINGEGEIRLTRAHNITRPTGTQLKDYQPGLNFIPPPVQDS